MASRIHWGSCQRLSILWVGGVGWWLGVVGGESQRCRRRSGNQSRKDPYYWYCGNQSRQQRDITHSLDLLAFAYNGRTGCSREYDVGGATVLLAKGVAGVPLHPTTAHVDDGHVSFDSVCHTRQCL